jgi:hypothetical protein
MKAPGAVASALTAAPRSAAESHGGKINASQS